MPVVSNNRELLEHLFEDTNLTGPWKLLALVLASHADQDGYCYPGIARLSKLTGTKERQTKELLRDLRDLEIAIPLGGKRPGHVRGFRLQKVQLTAPFKEVLKVRRTARLSEQRCSTASSKGAAECIETCSTPLPKVQSTASHNNSYEQSLNNLREQGKRCEKCNGKGWIRDQYKVPVPCPGCSEVKL